jgi:hypothetical protein
MGACPAVWPERIGRVKRYNTWLEESVNEIFPVLAGAAIGATVPRFLSGRPLAVVLAALSIIVGIAAAAISGELAESWLFVLFDTAQVAVVAVLTMALIALWQRRARRV